MGAAALVVERLVRACRQSRVRFFRFRARNWSVHIGSPGSTRLLITLALTSSHPLNVRLLSEFVQYGYFIIRCPIPSLKSIDATYNLGTNHRQPLRINAKHFLPLPLRICGTSAMTHNHIWLYTV